MADKAVELYEKDGKFAVLVSGGYGAGWSSWNTPELAYDRRVVEYWLENKHNHEFMKAINDYEDNATKIAAKEFFESLGYHNVYMGGFSQIRLEWVSHGTPFRITEYDGCEDVEIYGKAGFITL